ncbi:MAG TPA: VOC family protein [Patescibacteria group bacterium]|nr:VOC family protein [Patescibacteria group bacterium]
MNNVAFFEIQATDPEKSMAFYKTVFGWTFTEQPGMAIKYWHIDTEGITGGLLERPATAPGAGFGTNAFVCSMEVENFDEMAAKITANGGTVALPKFAVPGKCWQGYFLDADGNTFGIFQVDEHAA